MPELVTIETEKYDFVVWSKDVSRNQKRLEKTLAARGGEVSFSRIFLTPAVWLKGESEEVSEYDVGQPVFFENVCVICLTLAHATMYGGSDEATPRVRSAVLRG